MNDQIIQQNEDGTWSPAVPIKMPWWIRLSQWRAKRRG